MAEGTQAAKIGIIGAGPVGLAALKSVVETPQFRSGQWVPTVFEAREDVGGVWLPGESPSDSASQGPLPPTPIYDSLTTNLPHPIMAFSSFAFPPGTPLFPRAETVETYLKDFVSHHELMPYIRLSTRVQSVGWDERKNKWIAGVTAPTGDAYLAGHHEFDLILVCNGHHNVPRYPAIPGLQPWLDSDLASHSMFYRNPVASIPLSDISRATVLVVGGGPSGIDVTTDLLPVTGKVIFSSSKSSTKPLKSTGELSAGKAVTNKPGAARLDLQTKTATFEDGSEEMIDYCILATGYEVDFPFFEQGLSTLSQASADIGWPKYDLPKVLSSPIKIDNKHLSNSTWGVAPLVRQLFPFPRFASPSPSPSFSLTSIFGLSSPPSTPPPGSLAFLGLLVRVAPLPLAECQARAALAAFAYSSAIPDNMWDEEERALLQRKDALKAQYLESGGRLDTTKVEEYISKQWTRLPEDEQFDYRDELDELVRSLAQSDGRTSEAVFRKTKAWEREMYALKGPLRAAWRALEARGEADKWVEGVGRGESTGEDGKRRTPEDEWVDLMRRILDWWEREGPVAGR